ncbi:hypothetical protein Elgi_37110 [Paenibacillus elgii]|uniref:hypothetical protein n=1 Tax=Paenibacillus elgii TaxID=189691 RepID=UPI002D7D79DC|nr:hypothetical protein Elgi_37110 [Paenibacillus elgii]
MSNLALQEKFIDDKNFRNQYITKTEVLNKVKALTLLPDNEHMTAKMVANYYDVDEKTINQVILRNKQELIDSGLKLMTGNELKEAKKGFLQDVENIKWIFKLNVLPRRAILNIGMLLRDSKVAQEVRTYLLNVEEGATKELKSAAARFTGTWTPKEELILMDIVYKELGNGGTISNAAILAAEKVNHSSSACLQRFNNNLRPLITDERILTVIENNKRIKGKVVSLHNQTETSENSVELSKQIDKLFNNQLQQLDAMKKKIDLLNDEKKQLIEQVNELTLKNKEIEYDVNLKDFMLADKDQQIALIRESHEKEINSIKAESERIIAHLKTYKRKYRALEEVFNGQMRTERNKKTEEQKQKKGTAFTIQNGVPVFK